MRSTYCNPDISGDMAMGVGNRNADETRVAHSSVHHEVLCHGPHVSDLGSDMWDANGS